MKYLFLLLISISLLTGCVDRSTSVDAGVEIDVYPVTRTLQVKIEKNRTSAAYEKVISYISQHHDTIFNSEVSLIFATKSGKKLQSRVAKYLKSEGMDLQNLTLSNTAQEDNERFDFALKVFDYRVQVPLCSKPSTIYYSYKDTGCSVEANLWHSKVNPENSLRQHKAEQ